MFEVTKEETCAPTLSHTEKILLGGADEEYLYKLHKLKDEQTCYWYCCVAKSWFSFNLEKYLNALKEYTKNNVWHVSDITESETEQTITYEFTNTYDDLYY